MTNPGSDKDTMYALKLNPKITKDCPVCFVTYGPSVRSTLQKLEMYDGDIKIQDRPFELITFVCAKCGYIAKFYSDVVVKEWQTPVNSNSKS
jgi:hypothetical protein